MLVLATVLVQDAGSNTGTASTSPQSAPFAWPLQGQEAISTTQQYSCISAHSTVSRQDEGMIHSINP